MSNYILSLQINNDRDFLYARLFQGLEIPRIDSHLFDKGEIHIKYLTIRIAIYNQDGECLSIGDAISLPTSSNLRTQIETLLEVCKSKIQE